MESHSSLFCRFPDELGIPEMNTERGRVGEQLNWLESGMDAGGDFFSLCKRLAFGRVARMSPLEQAAQES